jgi:TctA family transporter
MIWVLVISNLMATALCLALGKPMARISFMPYYIVAPMVIVLCFMAAFAANFDWLDLVSLMVVSVIGYFMKELDWPRPPMVIGVVLGEKMERYLWLSTARYGAAWLLHPAVIVLLTLLLTSVVVAPILQHRRKKKTVLQRKHI